VRKRLKIVGRFALLGFVMVAGYQAMAVLKARQETQGIFKKILTEGNVSIRIGDMAAGRVEQLLAVEDPCFYEHNGVDLSTPGAGLTTITQAMVKYLYFDQFQPGFMKIEQTLIAWLAVDPLISKDDQLAVFVNTAYFGRVADVEVRGFAAAAKAYFYKTFDELTEDEYLSLVAMLIGPDDFSVKYHGDKNSERVARIKKVLSGEYQPQDNRDVYYGQRT
jgi:membrane peptidoglycan carboxypeptidase